MTLSLFSSSDGSSEEAYTEAFDHWLSVRRAREPAPLSRQSAATYRDMWSGYARYCVERAIGLHQVTAEDLELFLATRTGGSAVGGPARSRAKSVDLSPRYAWRLLTLIDRVLDAAAERDELVANASARTVLESEPYRYANAGERDPLPEHLSESQARALSGFVTALRPESAEGSWKDMRDRTAVALMLGAGLTPVDVRSLKIDGVIVDPARSAVPWKLAVPGNGRTPARETVLASWAGRQLRNWVEVREKAGIEGDYVFPAVREGTPWSHSRCYESCKDVLRRAGITDDVGLFALRHTFALRQLANKFSAEEVAQWLGVNVEAMARYRRIVMRPVDVV